MKVKVSNHIGLTLKLFKDSSYEFIRPDVSIEIEVENESEIPQALALAVKAEQATWDKCTDLIDAQVMAEMPQVNDKMQIQVSQKLKAFENTLNEFKKQLESKTKKVKND